MIVDDSTVIRSVIRTILTSDPEIEVVASAANGQAAIQLLPRSQADVVILDIEMPVMNGLDALPALLKVDPGVKVIVASTLSQRNAEISIKALTLGAADYVPKPASPREIGAEGGFRNELLAKVRSLGARARARRAFQVVSYHSATPSAAQPERKIALRKASQMRPRILAIGSSTGGPQALFALLRQLPATIDVPIVITQHMPPTFTAALAQHLGRAAGRPAKEAAEGEVLAPGTIYVAPGDHHLVLNARGTQIEAHLNQEPPENYCRPSVDPMLRSLAQAYGPRVLALMLTGMGSDGLSGATRVVQAGGTLVAQDEATSVVWGMPGAVATAGLCAAVLPLNDIANWLGHAFAGGVS
jgi:two-component system, chemotaxis family, protein-glutamate methylesterase/glutaminase